MEAGSSRMTMRSRARAAAAASPTGPSPTDPIDRLPAALAQRIFLILPAHDRMRCREVSRAWRAALADRGCWRVLRFSGCEDLPRVLGNPNGLENLILAAGRAAGGAAEVIDARGVPCDYSAFHITLMRLAEENGGSLRVLRLSGTGMSFAAVECPEGEEESLPSWLESGKLPRLEEFEADIVVYSISKARQLLADARQPDGRSKALRICQLAVHANGQYFSGVYRTPEKEREVAEGLEDFLQMDVPGHPSLTGLELISMPLLHPGLIDKVADAAVACGLESLHLYGRHINHTCLPALSRALRCGRLRSLELHYSSGSLDGGSRTLDGPRGTHEEFCAALRGSRLESLELGGLRLWADPDNSRALLAALTAHPTLRSLDISGNVCGDAAASAAAVDGIAALFEANAPAPVSLRIREFCGFSAARLERILGALRCNTHLTALDCAQFPGAVGWDDDAFAKRVVLPLVQANTTLRRLEWSSFPGRGAGRREIEEILAARAE